MEDDFPERNRFGEDAVGENTEYEMTDSAASVNFLLIALRFLAGGTVTAVFSYSLWWLTRGVGWGDVLAVGLYVPAFTWVVQLTASALMMPSAYLWRYWSDLSHICLLGSLALLPAAVLNFAIPNPARWWSVANVLASVGLMAGALFRRTARHGISIKWPVSWCVTIMVNMGLFCWASWDWW